MKSTGVVRRIDDLGRIVIPKEIRRSLRIREGDSLEIYSEGSEGITLRKYSQVESIESFINQYVEAIYSTTKKEIIVTDTEKVIAAAGSFRKDIILTNISVKDINDSNNNCNHDKARQTTCAVEQVVATFY